jgi:hypothetical protein
VSRTRAALAPILAALSVLVVVSGCAAGYGARTVQPYAPSDGIVTNSGSLRILDAIVVAAGDGDRAVLSMTVVNRGNRDDELTGIASKGGQVDLTGSRELPAGQAVRFGADTDPSATVENLTRAPGETIRLRLTFSRSQPVTLDTLVLRPLGAYASLTPGPQTPEDTETPSETSSSSESPSESASSGG